ncbi:hypothetical protein MUO69_07190, partial [Candidatus Bathyarchaeota archaeon]|nr:hypothetical protein [Candidatus Bathyarchaeota archaeon]
SLGSSSGKAGVDVWIIDRNLGINTRILNYLVHLKQTKPYPDETLRVIQWTLTHISKHADLDKSEQVNNFIASLQRSNNYKRKLVQNYAKFLDVCI